MDRIIEICSLLVKVELIDKLPDSFLAYVSDHGITISEGKNQRLTLARDLFNDFEILIPDKDTSSLDAILNILLRKNTTIRTMDKPIF